MKKFAIIPFIFWMVLSLMVIVLSYKIGLGELHNPGPGLMPFYVSVLLFIISFCLLLRYLLKRCYKEKTIKEGRSQIEFWKIATVVVSLIAYSLFLEKVGFLIATFILVTILFKTAGIKRWSLTLMGSVLTVLVAYFLFTHLGLSFPRGIFQSR
jgi:membrane-associated HD superfamily phosphohydrolase